MATTFKKGEVVKLSAVVPQGPVIALRMDENGVVQYLVEWEDATGVAHQRWFDEDQLTGA
jgi:uncharacterized protein YodC (DUF2158 family)|tara:strand:+ start:2156 stop:2335 length:180 start_codon:yes stop_codon:yes gene_type:complete